MGKFEEIIKSGKPIEVINKELKEAGANFHLNSNGTKSGWTEQEMKEGFQRGEPAAEVKHLHDYMRLNMKNAGKTVRVETPEGTYDITWNENGNPVSAVRVVK